MAVPMFKANFNHKLLKTNCYHLALFGTQFHIWLHFKYGKVINQFPYVIKNTGIKGLEFGFQRNNGLKRHMLFGNDDYYNRD